MDPEFLPEMGLLFCGLVIGAFAIVRLAKRQILSGLGMVVGSIGFICLAVFLGRSSLHTYRPDTWQEWGNSLALAPAESDSVRAHPPNRMFLMLGSVVVETVASERYTLSMAGEPFLELDLKGPGLIASCVVALERGGRIPITRNMFTHSIPAGIQLTRPDTHTILLQEEGRRLFRISYVSARRVDVAGTFYCEKCTSPVLLSAEKGIRWEGGAVPPGATIDLSPQGHGAIDLERSGRISVEHAE